MNLSLLKLSQRALLSLPCCFPLAFQGKPISSISVDYYASLRPLWRTLDPERRRELKPQCALFCPIPLLAVPKEHWQ